MTALVMALVAVFTATVGVLAACSGNDATGSTTTSPAAAPSTTTTAGQPFVSGLYGYSIDSTDWTGTPAPGLVRLASPDGLVRPVDTSQAGLLKGEGPRSLGRGPS
jgi:hypothetical protein